MSKENQIFQVGKVYLTQRGRKIRIETSSDQCVRGSDGKWRYSRESDAGRVTASAFDMSDPDNLVVGSEQASSFGVWYTPMWFRAAKLGCRITWEAAHLEFIYRRRRFREIKAEIFGQMMVDGKPMGGTK